MSRNVERAAGRVAGVVCAIATVLPLQAADFGSQQAYQFTNSNDQLAKVATATLMLQKKAGAFNYDYTTNIGQQVNCNQAISATGNAAQPSNSGSGIAPAGILNSGITASTTGNQSTATTTSTGSSGNQTTTTTSTMPLTPISGLPVATTTGLNAGGYGGTSGNNGQSSNGGTSNLVGQSNQGSALNSSVAGSSLSSQMGSINASGAQILNSVSSSQSNAGSTIMASADSSSACQWGGTSRSATTTGP